MTLVPGPSLADRVAAEGPLDDASLRRLATDLFAGLEATHAAGVLHRDLTPRNVLFAEDGAALLADFGIARGADDPTITAEHTIMGTRPFVAPERLRGADATVAADVYAVGVTLRFAALGRHDAPMPRDHPLAPVVAACTAEDPGRRPPSAAEAGRVVGAEASRNGGPGSVEATRALPPVDGATPTRPMPRATAPTRPAPATSPGHARDHRPVVALVLLGALAIAAVIASTAVRGGGPGAATPGTGAGTATDDAATSGPAPGFDPNDAPGSARRLAEWLRTQD
jgi:serine/threonine protein kinase